MNRLEPSSTYWSPSRACLGAHRRRVRARARLGQRIGGERLARGERGRNLRFCSSLPASLRASAPTCTARISPLVAQAFEISSTEDECLQRARPDAADSSSASGGKWRSRGTARRRPTGTRRTSRSRRRAARCGLGPARTWVADRGRAPSTGPPALRRFVRGARGPRAGSTGRAPRSPRPGDPQQWDLRDGLPGDVVRREGQVGRDGQAVEQQRRVLGWCERAEDHGREQPGFRPDEARVHPKPASAVRT